MIPWDDYCKMELIQENPKDMFLINALFVSFKKELELRSDSITQYLPTPQDFKKYCELNAQHFQPIVEDEN